MDDTQLRSWKLADEHGALCDRKPIKAKELTPLRMYYTVCANAFLPIWWEMVEGVSVVFSIYSLTAISSVLRQPTNFNYSPAILYDLHTSMAIIGSNC